jgi:hypothetical protein
MSARRIPSGANVLRTIQFALSTGVALASLWGLLGGCREQTTAPIDRNLAPETFLTSAPGDSQTSFYRVSVHWVGIDPDGVVVRYEVAVTDSVPREQDIQWHRTTRSDSLITFRVEETREVLGHRFYVRSIDNEGKSDPSPAWAFFGARDNLPPEVEFKEAIAFEPNSGETRILTSQDVVTPTDTIPTGWGVRFSWKGRDGDVAVLPDGTVEQVGRIDRYYHRLTPTESGYLPPDGSIADTAQQYEPEFFLRNPGGSAYAMQVRAVDDAGLSGSGSITRSFVWNRDPESRFERCLKPGATDSTACFESGGVTYYSRDTLALGTVIDPLPSLAAYATGYDPDPVDANHSVRGLEWRYGAGAFYTSWASLAPGSPIELSGMATGDYVLMVRSEDRLLRLEGTPDSLRFSVNLKPRFVLENPDLGFSQTPRPGDTFRQSQLTNGMVCRFLVVDPDGDQGQRIRYGLRWETPDERELLFSRQLDLAPDTVYEILDAAPRNGFSVGTYILTVQASDNSQAGGEVRGSRSKERAVSFQVIAD